MKLGSEAFRQFVEQASDAVLLLDADGIVVYANAASEELFGQATADLLGQSFGHIVTAEQPTEIEIHHSLGGTVTADIRTTSIILAGQSCDVVYLRDVTERKLNELAIIDTSHQLRERVKEQFCIRRVAEILFQSTTPLSTLLQTVVNVLPPAWQYPEVTVARITLDGHAYTSEDFSETQWRQCEDIAVNGKDVGTVEVCYTETRPEADEGPFLTEERDMLKLVALKVGQAMERRQAEEKLVRMNRILRVLNAVNLELVRAENEPALLETICRVCVDLAGYRMAWVGLAEQDEAKRVRPAAQAGFMDGYLERAEISWADDAHGRGIAGKAIRTGIPQVSQDLLTDPSMAPWHEEARQHGYASAIALPLADSSGTFGVLAIYAENTNAFGREECELLSELAGDLAFGIVTLRERARNKVVEDQIAHLAYHDELTDLPNRNQLMEVLTQTTRNLGAGEQCALLTLNVARFSDIRAGIGVRQADELLQQLADRIRHALHDDEFPVRVGGDEFAILLSHGGSTLALDCMKRIEQALIPPFQQAGIPISVQMRAGVAVAPDHGLEPEALLLRSGMAARQAKRAGTPFESYSGPTESESPRHLKLISELRASIEAKQFVVHYQPKVDLSEDKVSGVEALVRWPYPDRGLVPPGEFISIAEQTGLINPLTDIVLDAVIRQCSLWRDEDFDMRVAVNISVNNFTDTDFMSRIVAILQTWDVPAECLQLEITESVLMKEPKKVQDVLLQLKDVGIDVSIDDFGTGFSSLSYVASLSIHALKIDRYFVNRMLESPRTRSVVAATISLACSLGIRTVAEGVENKAQAEALIALGCSEIQGFYFSRPVEADELRRWVTEFSLAHYSLHPASRRTTGILPWRVDSDIRER